MTTLRTIPAHEIVQRTYPRPPPEEKDRVAMAVGKAIDGCLTQFGYEFRQGRRPTATAMRVVAESLLGEGLEEAAVEIPPGEKEKILVQPRTRVIVIDGRVGVYAQPDYWDGKARFFEMKSFLAIPPPPDVALQVRLFQLAFPQFEAVLLCINRHSQPVEVASTVIPFPTSEEVATALRLAYDLGVQFGVEKVLEYMQGPFVHYTLSTSPP
jgi:hypothetical protein